MIDLFLLEQLVTFEKCGTLTQAAETLHITQPALSRSMKKLEDEMGVSLFDRAKSKIALNETGKIAVRYAQRVLDANLEMVERTIACDRSRRTIVLGACAALPVNLLIPVFQDQFGHMAITSELASQEQLLSGLRNHIYQLVVLHKPPHEEGVFAQRYIDEHLAITAPLDHPFVKKTEVSFQDLDGMSILAHENARFWMEICKKHLPNSKLLAQNDIEVLHELIDASSLLAFSSDRAAAHGYESENRVVIPICDDDACTTYYLACLQSEKAKYSQVFNAVRSTVIRQN